MSLLAMALCSLPSLAFAAETIHASGFLRPFIIIAVVIICVIALMWCLKYWHEDIPAPLGKILTFAVIVIAVIIVIVVLLGVAGVHIT